MYKDLILNFQSPQAGITLTFEDNGEVGYAYIKNNNVIIGDVWLYNHKNIMEPEWNSSKNKPYLNPSSFIDEKGIITKQVTIDDVLVTWEKEPEGFVAYIYIFENLYGVLGVHDKPGYARFAIKDGPLAKVLKTE